MRQQELAHTFGIAGEVPEERIYHP